MEGARPATAEDIPRLATLWRAARDEIGSQVRGGGLFVVREARPEPVEEGLARDLEADDAVVLAGTIDDVIVGLATGEAERLRDGRLLGVVRELFVEPDARGVAVGEAMMAELLAWFGSKGCIGVDALALPGARATKNFFEASGFSARLLTMHHRLRHDDDA